ncbi:hypothetical protein MLD38_019730 [Melastoma candidum]|uniref:Uncharacterized protein n=1 Tax=Melastoma candidum TaxID=119954 RepID=A0ACB9QXE8_9MYRT|nr:hypothetical protein MLD38_019730 [Melastoma candidum]
MSLSCLSCPSAQRTNSDTDYRHDPCQNKLHRIDEERNWSGPLRSPPLDCTGRSGPIGGLPMNRTKSSRGPPHRLMCTSGELGFVRGEIETGADVVGEPRLIRSSGIRRDWSFEDLRQRRDGQRRDKGM